MVQIPHLQLHCFPWCFFCLVLCCSKSLVLLHRGNRCFPLFCIPLAVSSAEEVSQGQSQQQNTWLDPSILIPYLLGMPGNNHTQHPGQCHFPVPVPPAPATVVGTPDSLLVDSGDLPPGCSALQAVVCVSSSLMLCSMSGLV